MLYNSFIQSPLPNKKTTLSQKGRETMSLDFRLIPNTPFRSFRRDEIGLFALF